MQQIYNVIPYIYKCPNGGTSKGNAITGNGSGSSCSTAKSQAESNRIAEFNRNYTSYCNCNASCTSATVRLYSSSGIPAGATLNAQIKKGGSSSILITGNGSAPIGDYTVMHASYVVNGEITACSYSPTSFTLGCSGASITLSPYR